MPSDSTLRMLNALHLDFTKFEATQEEEDPAEDRPSLRQSRPIRRKSAPLVSWPSSPLPSPFSPSKQLRSSTPLHSPWPSPSSTSNVLPSQRSPSKLVPSARSPSKSQPSGTGAPPAHRSSLVSTSIETSLDVDTFSQPTARSYSPQKGDVMRFATVVKQARGVHEAARKMCGPGRKVADFAPTILPCLPNRPERNHRTDESYREDSGYRAAVPVHADVSGHLPLRLPGGRFLTKDGMLNTLIGGWMSGPSNPTDPASLLAPAAVVYGPGGAMALRSGSEAKTAAAARSAAKALTLRAAMAGRSRERRRETPGKEASEARSS